MHRIVFAAFKQANRPITRMVKTAIKARTSRNAEPTFLQKMIMNVGNKAYQLEEYITHNVTKDENISKGAINVKKKDEKKEVGIKDESISHKMNPEAAFNKGIDYICEFTLLYAVLVIFLVITERKVV